MHTFLGLSRFLIVLTLFCTFTATIVLTADTSSENNHHILRRNHTQRPRNLTRIVDIAPRDVDGHITRLNFSASSTFQVDAMKVKLGGIRGGTCISLQPQTISSRGGDACTVEDPANPGVAYHLQGFYPHVTPQRLPRSGELHICFTTIGADELLRRTLVVTVLLNESSVNSTLSRALEHILTNRWDASPHSKMNDLGQFSVSSFLSIQQSYSTYQGSATFSPCGRDIQRALMTSLVEVMSPVLGRLQTAINETTASDSHLLSCLRIWQIYHVIGANPASESDASKMNGLNKVSRSHHNGKETGVKITNKRNGLGFTGVGIKDAGACSSRTSMNPPTLTHPRRGLRGRPMFNGSIDALPTSSAVSSSRKVAFPMEESSATNVSLGTSNENPLPALTESSTGMFTSIISRVINYIKEHYVRLIVYFALAFIFLVATISACKSRRRHSYIAGIGSEEERFLVSSPEAYRWRNKFFGYMSPTDIGGSR